MPAAGPHPPLDTHHMAARRNCGTSYPHAPAAIRVAFCGAGLSKRHASAGWGGSQISGRASLAIARHGESLA